MPEPYFPAADGPVTLESFVTSITQGEKYVQARSVSFPFLPSFLFSPTWNHQRSKRPQMLFLTYLLSPSLDIVVQVAQSIVHLAEGLRITRGEMDWTFMGCISREG